jgi:hypothetical protein
VQIFEKLVKIHISKHVEDNEILILKLHFYQLVEKINGILKNKLNFDKIAHTYRHLFNVLGKCNGNAKNLVVLAAMRNFEQFRRKCA